MGERASERANELASLVAAAVRCGRTGGKERECRVRARTYGVYEYSVGRLGFEQKEIIQKMSC